MIDGETYGSLLVAIGVLLIGVGAVTTTVLQSKDFNIFFAIGALVAFLGVVLHISTEIYYDYKKWRS